MNSLQHFAITTTISLIFIVNGILKLTNNQLEIEQFIHFGYPLWFMYLTAIVNILAGIGLVYKNTFIISAVLLLLLLITSIVSILLNHDSAMTLMQPALVGVALIILITHGTPARKKYLLQ